MADELDGFLTVQIQKILSIVNIILIVFVSSYAIYLVPQFDEMYESFGTNIHPLTKLVRISYRYWLLLVIIPIGIYIKYLMKGNNLKSIPQIVLPIQLLLVLFLMILATFLIVILYLPIYELAA